MTTKKETKGQMITPEFRVSFPAVFKPKAALDGGDPKYSVTMLFAPGTDLSGLKALVKAAGVEKWGADLEKWPKLRLPFRDGAEKDYEGYGKGVVFCAASSKDRPGLVDQKVQPIMEQSDFYGGCYARATVTAFAYDRAGNKGIALGLRNIQKTRDGEAFSGKNKPENDFDEIATPEDNTAKAKTETRAGGADLGL